MLSAKLTKTPFNFQKFPINNFYTPRVAKNKYQFDIYNFNVSFSKSSRMKTKEFLLSTHANIHGLRTARSAYASQFAPEFNAINLMKPGELALSNILRELLDPQGSHAQGKKFLDAFIEKFSLPKLFNDRKISFVKTEQPTDTSDKTERYIDILIEFSGKSEKDKIAIAIENKPWAADGVDQMTDYLSHLQKRYPTGYALIYLAGGEGRQPAAHSIDKSFLDDIFIACYADLLPWLIACRSQCDAHSVQNFLQSFEQYIRQEFMGIKDMTEHQLLIQEATRSQENIEICLDIIAANLAIKNELIKKLEDQLREKIKNSNHSWHLLHGLNISNRFDSIAFQLKEGDQYTIDFCSSSPGGGDFHYGIQKSNETDNDLPEVRQALNQQFNTTGKTTPWWPWYLYFENPLRDWRISSKPWVQIASGEMAQWMIETVAKIEQGLQENNLASQLRGNGARHE